MTTHASWSHRPNNRSKIYKTKACINCSLRKKCTQNKKGRVIKRSEYQDTIYENNSRVIQSHDYYKLRQQIIEHPFGVLKRQWGFTYTLIFHRPCHLLANTSSRPLNKLRNKATFSSKERIYFFSAYNNRSAKIPPTLSSRCRTKSHSLFP